MFVRVINTTQCSVTTPTYEPLNQGIINMNRNGDFCKGTELAKLLQRLKSTLELNNKKVHWFFSYVCNGKSAVFWVLCCGITCKRALFFVWQKNYSQLQ